MEDWNISTPIQVSVNVQGFDAATLGGIPGSFYLNAGNLTGTIDSARIAGLDWSKITTGKPTTLAGYGISDAYSKTEIDTSLSSKQNISNELTALSNLIDTPGLIRKTGDGIYTIDANSYLTSNQNITLSGDVTGSGTTSINVSIPSIPWAKITTSPTTLSGYGIADPLVTLDTVQTVTGTKTFATPVIGSRGNVQFVLNQSGVTQPTALLSNQSGLFYFFCSDASASVNTTINALRPLTINLTSGLLSSANGQNFAGGISSSGTLTITNATASTSTTTGAIIAVGGIASQGTVTANIFSGLFQLKTFTTATRPVASASTLGQIWLNTTTGKIEYVATASTIQTITSA